MTISERMLNLIVPFLIFLGGRESTDEANHFYRYHRKPGQRETLLAPVQLNLYAAQKHTPDQNGRCHASQTPRRGLRPRSSTSLWLRAPLPPTKRSSWRTEFLPLCARFTRMSHKGIAKNRTHVFVRYQLCPSIPQNFRLDGEPDADG